MACIKCFKRDGVYFQASVKESLGTIISLVDNDGAAVTDTAILSDIENHIKGLATTLPVVEDLNCSRYNSLAVEFQKEDCDGNPVGDPIVAEPVLVVNKVDVSICNTDDITEPIVEAIEAKEEVDTIVDTIQVCGYNQEKDSYAKYLIRTTRTINNKTNVTTEKIEYTTNGKDWTETEPVDANNNPILFTIGDCAPVQLPEPCYENKSYEVGPAKGIVFAANTLFKYGGAFFNGGGGMIEGNNINNFISYEEGDQFGNGFGSLLKTLPNQVTVYTDSTGNAKISVMQVCGSTPQILDAVNGVIVTQATAVYPDETIDVTWNDIENETSYDIYRYETVDGVSTAVKIGTVAAGVTTYNDNTALPNVDYTYYVIGVNSVSQSISSNASVIIDKITGSITLAWTGTGYDSNDDFAMNAIYNP